MSTLRDEVDRLKGRTFYLCESVAFHRVSSNELSPCCCAALSSLRAGVIASAARSNNNIHGVLRYLQENFAWGVIRSIYLCDMMKHATELDCGSCTAVGLLALNIFLEYAKSLLIDRSSSAMFQSRAPTELAVVELIIRIDPGDMDLARRKLFSQYGRSAAKYATWIEDHCCYHKCCGLYSRASLRLMVWDYSTWLVPQEAPQSSLHAVIAIRIHPFPQRGSDTGEQDEKLLQNLLWNDKIPVPFGKWVDLMTSGRSLDSMLKFKNVENDFILSEPVFGVRNVSDLCIEGSRLKMQKLIASMFGTPVSRLENSGDTTLICEYFHDKFSCSTLNLSVFVSGCHMSSNPMPGVGVGRALRSWVSSQFLEIDHPSTSSMHARPQDLRLIGVDDVEFDCMSGIVDPVFDSARSLQALGYLHKRRFDDHLLFESSSSTGNDFDSKNLSGQELEDRLLWDEIVGMVCGSHDTFGASSYIGGSISSCPDLNGASPTDVRVYLPVPTFH